MNAKVIIIETTKQLLAKQSLSALTVEKITQTAGVSKTTFYKYFRDKYDMMAVYYKDEVINKIMKDYKGEDPYKKNEEVIRFIYDNQEYFSKVISEQGQNSFLQFYVELIEKIYRNYYLMNTGQTEITKEQEYKIYAQAVASAAMVEFWLKRKCDALPEEFCRWSMEIVPEAYILKKQTESSPEAPN